MRAGIHVRSLYDASKSGHTIGRVIRHAGRDYAFVRLKSGETAQYPCEQLELVPEIETRANAVADFRFAGPDSLQRAILTEKVRGRLTDIFYSMGSGHADFYPHQFKPVLKLVGSAAGRILIADEVGLGKTIEAIYVWKELQARFGARRLLVVCPSMLQPKWQAELRDRFSIDSTIVDARQLHHALQKTITDPTASFVMIGSLESLRSRRPKTDDDEIPRGARQQLAAFLAQTDDAREFDFFDLVVIDEAHYLRNPATAANYLGTILAAVSAHFVLLTATPIQLGSQNLFQLLTLLDEDRYANLDIFNLIRDANRPITEAMSAVLRNPPDMMLFRRAIAEAQSKPLFARDTILAELAAESINLRKPSERVRVARVLESRSLLGDVLTRTRKRDVIKNRVIRNAHVQKIELSNLERPVYDRVNTILRKRALNSDSSQTLTMIGRLRQLASSIPAAISGWRANDNLNELIWEDLGLIYEDSDFDKIDTSDFELPTDAELEAADTKYNNLVQLLRISGTPNEKVIVFSFYRGTVRYLERRLRADNVSCAVILGGMGDEKHRELERFADPAGPSVLLSTEVGSEGIDLQFARYLINYDLPWNPMKVEQRIGRIDRLGQKSDRIRSRHLSASNSRNVLCYFAMVCTPALLRSVYSGATAVRCARVEQ